MYIYISNYIYIVIRSGCIYTVYTYIVHTDIFARSHQVGVSVTFREAKTSP